jgi:ParB-like chromosome segregation protein Spo0J
MGALQRVLEEVAMMPPLPVEDEAEDEGDDDVAEDIDWEEAASEQQDGLDETPEGECVTDDEVYGLTPSGAAILVQPARISGGIEPGTFDIVTDDRLRHLLPRLSEEERAALERKILRDGCTDPLACYIRDGSLVLVDGHHRYEICQRHKLPFKTAVIEIRNIEQAQAWILEHARGRRNLTPVARRFVRGRSYNLQRAQGTRTDRQATSGQSDQKSTAQRLGDLYGVGEKTIRREAEFAETVDSVTAKYGVEFRARALAVKGLTARDFAALPQLDEPAAKVFVEQVVDGSYRPGAISKAVKEREGNAPRRSRPKPGDSVTFEFAERDGDHFAVVDLGTLRLRIDLSARSGRVSVLGRDEEGIATTA